MSKFLAEFEEINCDCFQSITLKDQRIFLSRPKNFPEGTISPLAKYNRVDSLDLKKKKFSLKKEKRFNPNTPPRNHQYKIQKSLASKPPQAYVSNLQPSNSHPYSSKFVLHTENSSSKIHGPKSWAVYQYSQQQPLCALNLQQSARFQQSPQNHQYYQHQSPPKQAFQSVPSQSFSYVTSFKHLAPIASIDLCEKPYYPIKEIQKYGIQPKNKVVQEIDHQQKKQLHIYMQHQLSTSQMQPLINVNVPKIKLQKNQTIIRPHSSSMKNKESPRHQNAYNQKYCVQVSPLKQSTQKGTPSVKKGTPSVKKGSQLAQSSNQNVIQQSPSYLKPKVNMLPKEIESLFDESEVDCDDVSDVIGRDIKVTLMQRHKDFDEGLPSNRLKTETITASDNTHTSEIKGSWQYGVPLINTEKMRKNVDRKNSNMKYSHIPC